MASSETTSNKNVLTNRGSSKIGLLGMKQYSNTPKSGKSDQDNQINYKTNEEILMKLNPQGILNLFILHLGLSQISNSSHFRKTIRIFHYLKLINLYILQILGKAL